MQRCHEFCQEPARSAARVVACVTMLRLEHRGGVMSIASKLAAALVGGLAVVGATWPGATLAGSIPAGKAEDVGMSSERLARIGPAMQRHIDAGEIAGVVTLVARRGQIVHFEAYGYSDIAKRTPMRTDHIFGLASSSKPITAVAILMLVESGDVRLSDPVSRYIPEFAAPAQVAVAKPGGAEGTFDLIPATRPITVADLLKHGSGLMSGGLGQRAAGTAAQRAPQDTLATYIPKLGAVPLDFQPGTRWRYSASDGIDVLSRIVEITSRTPIDVYQQQRIFGPLGMVDTAFWVPPEKAHRLAARHGMTLAELRQANGLSTRKRPVAGQPLLVRVRAGVKNADLPDVAARPVSLPRAVRAAKARTKVRGSAYTQRRPARSSKRACRANVREFHARSYRAAAGAVRCKPAR